MLAIALFFLSALAKTVTCVWPFSTNFLVWTWQSAVVVDQWLYIDGGDYYTLESDSTVNSYHYLAATLSIDLSQPWTVDSVSVRNNSYKPSAMSLVRRPQFWYDPLTNLVMERGGFAFDGCTTDSLWMFSPDGQGGAVWSLNGTVSRNAAQLTPSFGGAFIASATSYYSLGGAMMSIVNNNVVGVALEGLTIYESLTDTWKISHLLDGRRAGMPYNHRQLSCHNLAGQV
ncbi:hypothetical protein N7G274_001823 [Stereocaulon virgatum]|uniref:Uncharacterized protein n=1 Tax=Stereocaulon virgatum TaxID=373712 RepID=A0ABR4ALJ9_9LECA